MRFSNSLKVAWLAVFLMFEQTWACEAAHLKFEGTSLETSRLQIDKQQIFFFRGSRNQTLVAHAAKGDRWCYLSARRAPQSPLRGCLSAKLKRVLILRDLKGQAVATLKVSEGSLFANLLEPGGKPSGKRIQFTQVEENGERVLEVRGWNCPNPRFLSCVGAELKTLPDYVPMNEAAISQPIDLSRRLGHYRASCTGVHEATLEARK